MANAIVKVYARRIQDEQRKAQAEHREPTYTIDNVPETIREAVRATLNQ